MPTSADGAAAVPWRRVVLIVVATVLVLLLGWTAWVGIRSLMARDRLEQAVPRAAEVRDLLADGDAAGARRAAADFADQARAAADLTSDPLSTLAHGVPVVGPNLAALATISRVVDGIATDALPPLLPLLDSLDLAALAPVDGKIDTAPLSAAADPLEESSTALIRAQDQVAAIDTSATIAPVADAVTRLSDAVDGASSAVRSAATAARLLPAMLGAEEERRYLILFQNNAELRATGGIAGALALITTSDGAVELGTQTTANAFPYYPAPVLPVERAARSLGGPQLGRYMQNVNFGPEFPDAAAQAAQMWRLEYGTEVDGVIAVDPVALSYLLEATGPITLDTGDVIDSGNAVDLLLSEVYSRYSVPADQDLLFAAAARQVFAALTSGDVDVSRLIEAAATGSEERRILIWNARDDEQELLASTTFSGRLTDADDTTDVVGVYLNDATGAKMDYYLDASSVVYANSCETVATWRTEVTIASAAPLDAATSLPAYVTGGGFAQVPPGTIRTKLLVYGPAGSIIESVQQDGKPVPAQVEEQYGRGVTQVVVDLLPGESTVIEVAHRGPDTDRPGQTTRQTEVRMTPLVDSPESEIVSSICR